jgi:hypothetical protein
MFPKAPNVEVYAPTSLVVGQDVGVEIVVTAEEPVKVEYIDAHITGHQGWRVGSGKNAVTMRHEYPTLTARLRGEGQLATGTSRYQTHFRLPADMPPSHAMAPAWAYLELFVRVAIPWWPDGKYKFTLPVRSSAPPSIAREPYAIRSTPSATEPRLEVSLASTQLIAGESVVGSVAVFHVDDRKPRELELSLVPSFKLYRGRSIRERRGNTLGVTVEIPAGGAGTSVPFRFRLPSDITPTFTTLTHDLRWWLVAKTGSFFRGKLELAVPLHIYDAAAAEKSERLTVAPRLSDERITAAFAAFAAQHGWQQTADPDDPEQLVYEREAGDSTLLLGYSYRGEAGSFLVARVAHPPLGLGLDVTPSSRLREMFTSDIEIDLDDWDRAHHVFARSPIQTQPYLRATASAVMQARSVLGLMRNWNDHELVFERQVAAIEPADLVRAATVLDALAPALRAPIDPPAELAVDIGAWKQLAKRLDGQLSPGDLMIEGTFEHRPVTIALEFDGERPTHVYVRMGDAEAPVSEGFELGRLDVTRIDELLRKLRAQLAEREPNLGPYR